jgi:hypothetical protein
MASLKAEEKIMVTIRLPVAVVPTSFGTMAINETRQVVKEN